MSASRKRFERLATEGANCRGSTVEECTAERSSPGTERSSLVAAGSAAADSAADDVAALSAMANETRYELVRLLHAADGELCVCELDVATGVSDSAVSHALRTLRDADLVTARKEGRWKYYQTTDRATALLVALEGTR